eukprot:GDKH01011830.1.p1 GENE.GDKH01011830.1~~GDKH01011830.1.p1  ORF type:complete len:347 (+),score=1.89 GDKH01011830.1:186-1226(+)
MQRNSVESTGRGSVDVTPCKKAFDTHKVNRAAVVTLSPRYILLSVIENIYFLAFLAYSGPIVSYALGDRFDRVRHAAPEVWTFCINYALFLPYSLFCAMGTRVDPAQGVVSYIHGKESLSTFLVSFCIIGFAAVLLGNISTLLPKFMVFFAWHREEYNNHPEICFLVEFASSFVYSINLVIALIVNPIVPRWRFFGLAVNCLIVAYGGRYTMGGPLLNAGYSLMAGVWYRSPKATLLFIMANLSAAAIAAWVFNPHIGEGRGKRAFFAQRIVRCALWVCGAYRKGISQGNTASPKETTSAKPNRRGSNARKHISNSIKIQNLDTDGQKKGPTSPTRRSPGNRKTSL